MQEQEKKFLNTTLGEQHSFRFRWGIDSYNKADRRFALILTISQTNYTSIDKRDSYTLNNYPEILAILSEVGLKPRIGVFQIRIPFEKSDSRKTILNRILEINKALSTNGIAHSNTSGIGFVPDLTYAAKYLEYTISDEDINIKDILLAMCGGDRNRFTNSLSDILAKSESKFNPEEDTNLDFIIQRNELRMNNICKNLEKLNRMVSNSNSDKSSEVESTETYSSDNSENYSSFQCNWI